MSSVRASTLVALAACALLVSGAANPARAEQAARIVILPVVVHTAAPDAGYVSRGIQDMLAARIEQLGSVTVLRPEDPKLATTRVAAAREAGRRAGGDYVLFGAFTQFGDGASLDIQVAGMAEGVPDTSRSIFIQSGTMGEIIPKLDALADKVVRHVGGKPTPPAGSGATGADATAVADLRRRLEALEQAVFQPNASARPTGPAPAPES